MLNKFGEFFVIMSVVYHFPSSRNHGRVVCLLFDVAFSIGYGFVKGQGCHVYHFFFLHTKITQLQGWIPEVLRSSCRRSNCWFDHPTESRALSLDRASHSGRSRGRTLRLCHYGYYCGLAESMRKKWRSKLWVWLKRSGSSQIFGRWVVLHEFPHGLVVVLVSVRSICVWCLMLLIFVFDPSFQWTVWFLLFPI